MTERLITHLRHVDLAVPDYDKQRDFYTDIWGLTEVEAEDPGLTFLAAEGSPEQYIVRLRKAEEKRLDLIAFGARDAAAVDTLAERLAQGGVQLVTEPGKLQTPGGGYGFRFFDADGRTIEISADVAVRQHRKIEEKRVDPGPALARGASTPPTRTRTRDFYEKPPRLPALRHPLQPAHGRGDALHAEQRPAPQPRHRPRPARLAAPRVVRDARPRRVHARHRPADARRGQEDLGSRPPHGGQQHLLLLPRPARQHRRVHDRARDASTRTPGTRTSTTSPTPRSPTSGAPPTR